MKLRRSSLLAKIIVILPLAAATITLVSLQTQLDDKQAELTTLEQQSNALTQENQRLEDAIAAAGTDEGIMSIAREKLGMVEKNEIVFYDIGN